MPGPLLVVDAPSMLYRAFFALPKSIKGADGRPVNALLGTANLVIRDRPEGLAALRPSRRAGASVPADKRAALDAPLSSRKRPDPGEVAGRLALAYVSRSDDYRAGSVTAMVLDGSASAARSAGLVLDGNGARQVAETLLAFARNDGETLEFALPPSMAALEAGDVVSVEGQEDGPFLITALRDADARRVSARVLAAPLDFAFAASPSASARGGATAGAAPVVVSAWLPADGSAITPARLAFGAFAQPWPGLVTIDEAATGAQLARLGRPATLGVLASALDAGPAALWDRANAPEVTLYGGHLSSASEAAVLSGANRLAVQHDGGGWEILGFAGASLVSPATYRLTGLLRGLGGTLDGLVGTASAGRPVLLLDDGVAIVEASGAEIGAALDFIAYAGAADPTGEPFGVSLDLSPLLPLAPTRLSAKRDAATGDLTLSWIRRGRVDATGWAATEIPLDYAPEAYEVTILDGQTPLRTLTVAEHTMLYAAADQTADFAGLATEFTLRVAQVSAVYGPGHSAETTFSTWQIPL